MSTSDDNQQVSNFLLSSTLYHLQLCEGLGLLHASVGQGEDRYIQVRKVLHTTVSEKTAVTETSSTKNTSHQHQGSRLAHSLCSLFYTAIPVV